MDAILDAVIWDAVLAAIVVAIPTWGLWRLEKRRWLMGQIDKIKQDIENHSRFLSEYQFLLTGVLKVSQVNISALDVFESVDYASKKSISENDINAIRPIFTYQTSPIRHPDCLNGRLYDNYGEVLQKINLANAAINGFNESVRAMFRSLSDIDVDRPSERARMHGYIRELINSVRMALKEVDATFMLSLVIVDLNNSKNRNFRVLWAGIRPVA